MHCTRKARNVADLMAQGHSLAEAITIATEAARARPPFDYAESERLRKLRHKLLRERNAAREPWDNPVKPEGR